jgi:ABC-type Fe3+ transport system permease subunit
MRWVVCFAFLAPAIALPFWASVYVTHGWRYNWYTGRDDPFFAERQVSAWDQIIYSLIVGLIGALLMLVVAKLGMIVYNLVLPPANANPIASDNENLPL